MSYVLSGDEKIDGEPEIDIELRRESLYIYPPEGGRHAFAYGHEIAINGGAISTLEMSYPLLRQIVRWANSPQGRRLLAERGVEVDW